jgi:ribulose 1,5-bisphosphate synthetase/thiazole synthase
MIPNTRDENVELNRTIQIAVIGAGPAEMTLARELAEAAPALGIESGGFEAAPGRGGAPVG